MHFNNRQSNLTRREKNDLLRAKLLAREDQYEGGGLDPDALARLDEDYDNNIEFQKEMAE